MKFHARLRTARPLNSRTLIRQRSEKDGRMRASDVLESINKCEHAWNVGDVLSHDSERVRLNMT
jgi:hypothetical protein